MCGIIGSSEQFNDNNLKLLSHRGPDNSGLFSDEKFSLGHVRLSIIDLSAGNQPFQIGEKILVYNGEIYNFKELREEYQIECQTESDTELLLRLIIKIGLVRTLDIIDGMFAFVVYDLKSESLFGARDRCGEKPFYYSTAVGFSFASEINALVSIIPNTTLNKTALTTYLEYGSMFQDYSPFNEINELPPGNYFIYNLKDKTLDVRRYWNSLNFLKKKQNISLSKAKEKLDKMLYSAVERNLINSDVGCGVFLSGGIDSSLVAYYASKIKPDITSYTVRFEHSNEEVIAANTASYLGINNQIIDVGFDNVKNDLDNILSFYGSPFFDSSAIPSYYVAKAASCYEKVVLSGDGADELFGGYRRHIVSKHWNLFKLLSLFGKSHMTNNMDKSQFSYRLARLSRIFSEYDREKQLLRMSVDLFELGNKIDLNLGDLKTKLDEQIAFDFNYLLRDELLPKMDIASMRNSLEVRNPFLSKDLVEFGLSLPDDLKVRGLQTKYLLRSLAKDVFPGELHKLPKVGFEIPLAKWVNYDLRDQIISGVLSFEKEYSAEFGIDLKNLVEKSNTHVYSYHDAKLIWTVYSLYRWLQEQR